MLFRWRSRRKQSCSCSGHPDLVLSPDTCSRPGFPRFSLIKAGSKVRALCHPPAPGCAVCPRTVSLSVPALRAASPHQCSGCFLSFPLLLPQCEIPGCCDLHSSAQEQAWAELTMLGKEAKVDKFAVEQRPSDKARRTNCFLAASALTILFLHSVVLILTSVWNSLFRRSRVCGGGGPACCKFKKQSSGICDPSFYIS